MLEGDWTDWTAAAAAALEGLDGLDELDRRCRGWAGRTGLPLSRLYWRGWVEMKIGPMGR